MRRRLDLAVSLIARPQVLFLDEPTTGLDPRGRTEVWTAVRALVTAGTTVLLTTQYLEEADQLADRIAVITAGRVIAEGSPDDGLRYRDDHGRGGHPRRPRGDRSVPVPADGLLRSAAGTQRRRPAQCRRRTGSDDRLRAGGSWAAEHALVLAVAWPLLLVAVFLPLSVRHYRRLQH